MTDDGDLFVPAGVIAMWAGTLASIPTGWNLCDGTSGTPDLRQKFLRGAPASTEAGTTGGAITHTHTETSAGAAHTHVIEGAGAHQHIVNSAGSHNHGATASMLTNGGSSKSESNASDGGLHRHTTNYSVTHNHSGATSSAGGAHTHTIGNGVDTRPPYYDILFIQASLTATVVSGLIIIWSGTVANIPAGWVEFTTLQSTFPEGAAAGLGAGASGGSVNHTHTTSQANSHTHTMASSDGNHTHTFNNDLVTHDHGSYQKLYNTPTKNCQTTVAYNWYHQHATSDSIGAHTHTVDNSGGSPVTHNHGNLGSADSNKSLPAYIQAVYIQCTYGLDIPEGGIFIWVGTLASIGTGALSQYALCNGTSPTTRL